MATIKDVAREANVSIATVSRVLNNRGYISDATKNAVQAAIEKLSYRPNEVARTLYRNQSLFIGLIIPSVAHPFFSELTRFVEYYANRAGYKILLCNSLVDKKKEQQYIELLKCNQVAGIIMGSHTLETSEYLNLEFPLVSIDRRLSPEIPYISSDNYSGGVQATRLLIEKGCKNLIHFSGNLSLNMLANLRNDAFIETCKSADISYWIYEEDINAMETINYNASILKAFKDHPEVDGVFASSDVIAASVIQICHKLKKRVPEDIKIIGYDDSIIAKMASPQISTVAQPIEMMAKHLVQSVVKQIQGEIVPSETVLPIKVIPRGTT